MAVDRVGCSARSGTLEQVQSVGFALVRALRLRGLAVAASVLGLLAMHGLSADHVVAMPRMQLAQGHAMAALQQPVSAVTDGPASTAASALDQASMASHTQCLATLPSATHQLGAPSESPVTPPWRHQTPTLSAIATELGRGPPQVLLARLCISRT